MPGSGAKYAAINAWVRARYARLLTPANLAELADAADFNALIGLLKQTAYGPHLQRVDERELTPRRAVYQIKNQLADSYATVIQAAPVHARPLLIQLYRSYEIDNLKAVLRGIVTGASWDRVRYVLFPFGPLTVLPAEAMLEAGNVSAAIELLRGTLYYETLAFALERYTIEQSLFPLEVALDLGYWRNLWSTMSHLSGDDRQQAMRTAGQLVDIHNLMWAIRYRVYHHLSEEEVINYTLPFGYRVKDESIRAIAAGADILQVVKRIYPTLTGIDELLQDSQNGIQELETRLQRYLAGECRATFSGYPFHIGVPLAYLILSEMEIQDMVVLVEAKSTQLPKERFRPYLSLEYAV